MRADTAGASPGGVAVLVVVPEHDFAFAAFGNDPRAMMLHDQIMLWLLREHLDVEVPDLLSDTAPVSDLTRYVGTYRSNQLGVDVSVVDGQLEETMTYEPLDDVQARIFSRFAGGTLPIPAEALRPNSRGPLRAGRDAAPGLQRVLAPAPGLVPRLQ